MLKIQELIRSRSSDITSALQESQIIMKQMLSLTKERVDREKRKKAPLTEKNVYKPIGACSFTFTNNFAKEVKCEGNIYSLSTSHYEFRTLISNIVFHSAAFC